jgi:DNA-binding GntR family transcriptional regulator
VTKLDRPDPPYLQVARLIREQITSGQLAEGDTVPSARQIAATYDIAHATATKVLKTLEAEGLVRGVVGVGTVVQAAALHRSARDRSTSVLHTGRIYPEGHYAKILVAGLGPASDEVALALGLQPGAQVIRRQRTTYDSSGTPLSTSTSWFDGALAEVAPLLLRPERILQGTFAYVEQQTKRVRSQNEKLILSSGRATQHEAEQLDVEPDSPVLRGRNFFWDVDGVVIEYGESTAKEGLETIIEFNVSEATK